MNKSFYAIAMISGTIIGAGIFSLPYIASKVGLLLMFFYIVVLGILVNLVHLYLGEIALQTPDNKRLAGFAKIHLGDWAEKIASFSTIFGFFGALLAYLVIGGEFLGNLLSPIFGGSSFFYVILFFSLGSFVIFSGIKAIAKIEFWGMFLFLTILLFIFFNKISLISGANLVFLPKSLGSGNWFLPYGPILFSLWGASIIPEAEEMIPDKKHLLKKILVSAILIPIFVYLLFTFLVLGITGTQTTESALGGLGKALGSGFMSLVFLFGFLTTFNAFLSAGVTLKKSFLYDLKIERKIAWAITCFVPLILFLMGIKSFIPIISIIGGVTIGIDGILILLMYHKINRKNILVYPLILIFIFGIIYEIIYFVK